LVGEFPGLQDASGNSFAALSTTMLKEIPDGFFTHILCTWVGDDQNWEGYLSIFLSAHGFSTWGNLDLLIA
jgi:hypothetical protein